MLGYILGTLAILAVLVLAVGALSACMLSSQISQEEESAERRRETT